MKNLSTRMLAAAIGLSLLGSVAANAAVPATTVYDGFSYSGSLIGQNGGTGWSGAWYRYYGSGGDMAFDSSGATYTGLTVVGGKATFGSGGNGISQCERSVPQFNSGVVYIQFIANLEGGSSGGGTPQIRLSQGTSVSIAFGGNGGTYASKMSILSPSLGAMSDGTSSTSANLNANNFVIVRIDYAANNTKMWVNPNLATFDYYNPPAHNAIYNSLAPAFNSVGFYTRSPGWFDEFRIMQISGNSPTDIALSASSINENNAANATVGTLSATDADVGETFTFSLATGTGDTDNASFTISGNSLRLTPSANYEAKSSYSVRIQATDSTSNSYSEAFTITINDAAETPTDISLSAAAVAENVAANTTVGALSTTDPDTGNTFTYTLVAGTGDTDNAAFNILGSSLRITNSPNYEAQSSYSVRVRSTDSGTLFFEKALTITISNVNEAPTISDTTNQTIDEDGATSALAFTIGDPETAAGSLTVTRNSDNLALVPLTNIVLGGSGANRTVTVTPVADGNGTATITVTVSDGSLSTVDTFVLTVNGVNDAPTFFAGDSELAYETVNPIRSSNNIVYSVNNSATLAATPFSRVRYRMQVDVSGVTRYADVSFDAWSGLTVADLRVPTPNTPFVIQRNVTNMTVDSNYATVTNATGQTGRLEIWPYNYGTGTVAAVGGNPSTYDFDDTHAGSASYGSFQVHNLSAATKHTVLAWNNHSANPPDVGFGNSTGAHPDWTFAGAGGLGISNWKLQIYIGTDGLPSTFTVTEDTESNLLMGGTPFIDLDSGSLTVTLEIADGVITGNAGTGVTVGGSATARTFTGSVADLNTYFTTAGKVTYLGVTNNITARSLTITADDGVAAPAVTTSTVNFTPVNDLPTDIALSSATIAENNSANATVGTLSSTDLDAAETFSYTLVSGAGSTDNASFTISGNALRLTPSANYEVKGAYAVRVRTTDSSGGTYEEAFTITVTNVPETPSDITLSNSTLAENVTANATVGTLSTTDQDTSDTFAYTLVSGTGSTDNASFEIFGGNSLRLLPSPNYEVKSSYAIRVRSTDSASLYFEKQFTITITNVNEPPTITDISDLSINEDGTTGALSFTISDPETAAGSLTVTRASGNTTLVPLANAILGGSGGTRTVTVTPSANLHGSALITVTVSDGTLSVDDTFTLTVTAVNDAPSFVLGSPITVAEDAGAQTHATFATSISAGPANESGQAVIFNVSNNNNSLFSAQPAIASNGTLTFTTAADANGSATVSVTANDDGGTASGGVNTSATQTFTITVTPGNDAPTNIALSSATIAENNAANATVGTLSSTDGDSGDTHTYTLVSGTGDADNGSFTISGSSLRLTPSADFETKSSYAVRVRSTDSGSLDFERDFTISITNANETPTNLVLSSSLVVENVPANSAVGTFSTTDVDAADTFTYTLVSGTGSTDNAAFNIAGDALRIANVPKLSAQGSYSVRVRTTDAGGLFFENAFTITVIAPEISVAESSVELFSGDSINFGPVALGTNATRTFTIDNGGSADLTGIAVTFDGAHASDFTVTASPSATVSASGQTTFTVTFAPGASGSRSAAMHIASNDDDENPFDISFSGRSGPAGAALAFDGSGDTVEIPAHADFSTPTFTIEAWVKPNSTMPQWARVWGTENNKADLIVKTGSENRFSFAPFIDGDFAYLYAPTTWTSGQWYHVAGVVDHLMVRLFVNGVQVASMPKTAAWAGDSGKRFIGNCTAPSTANRFKGMIDEVRYWDYARNCDQISQARSGELTGAESGLVAYYRFNQGLGGHDNSGITTATDATGHGHHANLTNFSLADGNITSNWVSPGAVAYGVLAPTPQFAELDVEGNNSTILDGDTTPHEDDHTDFGDTTSASTRTFTLRNAGNIDLNVTDITLSGSEAAEFEIGGITLPTVIPGGASVTFTVATDANPSGCRRATVTITCDDCDEDAYEFAIQSAPPIAITTTGGTLSLTDEAPAGGTLSISEPTPGSIRLEHTTRAFVIDGGSRQFGDSGSLSLSGISEIDLAAGPGDDEIRIGAFAAALPDFTISSGTGSDNVCFDGDLTFASGASLAVDANGTVAVATDAEVIAASAGGISITAAKSVRLSAGARLQTENGALEIAANQQPLASTGNFAGVLIAGGVIESTGTGAVTISGRGGDHASGFQMGVRVAAGGRIVSASGDLTIAGTGGDSAGFSNYGVHVSGALSTIATSSSVLSITAHEGAGPTGIGMVVDSAGTISSTAAAATVVVASDSMHLPDASISTHSEGFVYLKPATFGVGMNIGLGSNAIGGPLSLTDFELDGISTGHLDLSANGPITQSATLSRSAATDIAIRANGGQLTLSAGTIVSAGGDVHLEAPQGLSALGAGLDVDAGADGVASFAGSQFHFAINSPAANTGYQQLAVAGKVKLTGAVLNLTGSLTPTKGQSFTLIDNDGTDPVDDTFTGLSEGSTITFNGVPLVISYVGGTGNDVTVSYAAPTLTLARSSIICNEGATATNNGTLLDLQGNVSLTASVGSVSDNGNGTWTWSHTPADGPDATSIVTITAEDDSLPPLTATVSFPFTVKNVSPKALSQVVTVAEDASATPITLAAIEPGADALVYTLVSVPSVKCGTLSSLSGNVFQFTPAPDYAGTTKLTFKATDSDGAVSNLASVTIQVIGSDDAPAFVAGDSKVHPTGTATNQTFSGWARAISDGDANLTQTVAFTVTEVGDSGIFTTPPAISSTGVLTYRPNGTMGTATFSVTLADSGGMVSAPQTFSITVATFSPGTYTGLAEPDTGGTPTQQNVGLLSGTLTSRGSFTGKANFAGTTTSFTAVFSLATGNATGSNGSTLGWDLHLDVLGGTDKITGTVSRLSGGSVTEVCAVDADRATFTSTNRVPGQFLTSTSTGLYTLALAAKEQTPALDLSAYPQGDGFGKATVSATGLVTFSGTLADGSTVTASAPLSKAFQWPLAILVKQTTAVPGTTLAGMVQFDTAPVDTDLSAADLLWFRGALPTAKNYASGWPAGVTVDAVGARYITTTNLQTTLAVATNEGPDGGALLSFDEGKLTEAITRPLKVSGNVITKSTAASTYTLSAVPTAGTFTGTFTPNWSSLNTTKPAFKGILIQKGANRGGYGFFLSNAKNDTAPESGRVTLATP